MKCETVDLEVPADAEIVLEGHIPPHYREEEGPFSEFQDYYVTGTGKNPIVEYQYMTRRRDAIFKNLQNGSEMEGCVFHKIPMSATIYRRLKDVGGGPNLHNVMVLPGIFGVVVQMTPRFYGEAKNLLMAALSVRVPASEGRHGGRCRRRHLQSRRAAVGAVDAGQSAGGRGGHSGHAQPRHGREPARARRRPARRCGSGSARRC